MARILLMLSKALCRAPRPQKEARALAEAGHSVSVVTQAFTEEEVARDRELADGAPFELVYLNRFDLPQWRHRMAWTMARARRHLGLRLRTQGALGYGMGDMARHVERTRPDLAIAHTEAPLALLPRLAARGIRVGVDFEDWYSEDLPPEKRARLPIHLVRRAERWAMHHAPYRVAASRAMAEALCSSTGCDSVPTVVSNTFPIEGHWLPPQVDSSPAPLRIVWFSQTVGLDRGLGFFLGGMKQAIVPALVTVIGDCRGEVEQALRSEVADAPEVQLRFLPAVKPGDLHGELCRHEIGLCLEDPSIPSRDVTVTNKMFQYLMAGLGIVATRTRGQSEVMATSGGMGAMIDHGSEAQVAAVVRAWHEDRRALAAARHEARRAALEDWNWEATKPALVAEAERALEGRPA